MLNFIDLRKMLLSNFKRLNIDSNDLLVLFAIHDLKAVKKTPLPDDVVKFLGLSEATVNKSYTDLLTAGYIEVKANEICLEGTLTNLQNLDLVNADPSKLIDQSIILIESKAKAKLSASQAEFVKTAISQYGIEEFKNIINNPKCKGTPDDMISFFIETMVPKTKTNKVSRTKWVNN